MPAIYAIPLVIVANWLLTVVMAIPCWLLWTVCGVGGRYFDFLPAAWRSVPLVHMAGLFLLFAIGRSAVSPVKFEIKA